MSNLAQPPDLSTLLAGRPLPTRVQNKTSQAPPPPPAQPAVEIPAGVNPAEGKFFCANCEDKGYRFITRYPALYGGKTPIRFAAQCICIATNPVLANARRTARMLRGA